MFYYLVKFKEQVDTDKGPKWVSDQHLVQAYSVTDAEATLVSKFEGTGEIDIQSVTKSKITKVIEEDE